MRLLSCLTEIFISTFGITRPKPAQQRLANVVIGGSLLVFSVAVLSVLGFLIYQFTAGGR
jgi:hypothetical protein